MSDLYVPMGDVDYMIIKKAIMSWNAQCTAWAMPWLFSIFLWAYFPYPCICGIRTCSFHIFVSVSDFLCRVFTISIAARWGLLVGNFFRPLYRISRLDPTKKFHSTHSKMQSSSSWYPYRFLWFLVPHVAKSESAQFLCSVTRSEFCSIWSIW